MSNSSFKLSGKTHVSPSFSLLKNMGTQRENMAHEEGNCKRVRAANEDKASGESAEKHFQGCFFWHWMRCPCCSLKMLSDDKLKLTAFQNQKLEEMKEGTAGRNWSESQLSARQRGQINHLFSHLNKLFKFTLLYATQGLSGSFNVPALPDGWGRTM